MPNITLGATAAQLHNLKDMGLDPRAAKAKWEQSQQRQGKHFYFLFIFSFFKVNIFNVMSITDKAMFTMA